MNLEQVLSVIYVVVALFFAVLTVLSHGEMRSKGIAVTTQNRIADWSLPIGIVLLAGHSYFTSSVAPLSVLVMFWPLPCVIWGVLFRHWTLQTATFRRASNSTNQP